MIIEIQIVKYTETHSQHFLCFQKMTDIGSAVMLACRTLTAFFDRTCVQFIFCIEQIHLSMIGIYMSMTTVTAWIYAVKEINSTFNTFQNIGRCSHTHQVSRFILRKIGDYRIQDPVHLFMGFSNCQTADSIAIQIHFRDRFGMLNTDIFINSTLVDSKQKLFFVNGIRQTVQSRHFRFTAGKPSCGPIYRFLHIIPVSHTAWTFIKCHGNGGGKIGLDLHTLFRSHKDLMSINMGVKIDSLFFDLSQLCKGKYLESA